MKAKTLTVILLILTITGLSAATLEFRTQSPIQSYSSIDLNGNRLLNVDYLDDAGGEVDFGDVAVFQDGLSSYGDISLKGNQLDRVQAVNSDGSDLDLLSSGSGSDGVTVYDAANSEYLAMFNEGGPIVFRNSVTGNDMLRMNSSAGSTVEIPNGNLDMNGNIRFSGSEMVSWEDTNSDGSNPRITTDASDRMYLMGWNGIARFRADNGNDIVKFYEGGSVEIPNGNILFQDQDSMITNHDGNGNFNIKTGVDSNQNIVAGQGGTHVRMDENGGFDVSVDESTSAGNTMGEDIGLEVNNGVVQVKNANLDMNGNKIDNLATPTDSDDAATKGYVDSNSGDALGDGSNLNYYTDQDEDYALNGEMYAEASVRCPSGETPIAYDKDTDYDGCGSDYSANVGPTVYRRIREGGWEWVNTSIYQDGTCDDAGCEAKVMIACKP